MATAKIKNEFRGGTAATMVPHVPDEDAEGEIDFRQTLTATLTDIVYLPFRILVSKPAQRAYLTIIFFTVAGFLLAICATLLYFFFYYMYIPDRSITLPVYLDYSSVDKGFLGNESVLLKYSPSGRTDISSVKASLLSNQAYDVTVQLHLPRTERNIDMGNFMIDVALTSPDYLAKSTGDSKDENDGGGEGVIARSRRPSILTQRSWVLEITSKLIALPWYLAGWKAEAELLEVSMFENLHFGRGWRNVPKAVALRLESEQRPQVYSARVKIEARLSGLQWIMYRHRVFSFVVITFIFWAAEMSTALVVYLVLSYYYSSGFSSSSSSVEDQDYDGVDSFERGRRRGGASKSVRSLQDVRMLDLGIDDSTTDATAAEELDLSDTSRTFPTFSRQPPLRYSAAAATAARGAVKLEPDEDAATFDTLEDARIRPRASASTGMAATVEDAGAEADDDYDEDEDADYVLDASLNISGIGGGGMGLHSDSGIGSSLDGAGSASATGAAESVRRRKASSRRECDGNGGALR